MLTANLVLITLHRQERFAKSSPDLSTLVIITLRTMKSPPQLAELHLQTKYVHHIHVSESPDNGDLWVSAHHVGQKGISGHGDRIVLGC
jgi:hypothetical protein